MTTIEILKKAKSAKMLVALADTETKNKALHAMAKALCNNVENILLANKADCEAAKGVISDVMLDRLLLTKDRIEAMAKGMQEVAALPDPVGAISDRVERPNGIVIEKTAVPMGLIAIIYESRPNVTSDAAALALKSGSVCVLRSGKEAWRSANAIVKALQEALVEVNLPREAISLIEDTTRESANELMRAVGLVDLLIPRGGASLIRACVENAKVPCLETGTGICHIYIENDAKIEMALDILENAKASRPSVCNAAEVCLVQGSVKKDVLPLIYERLYSQRRTQNLPAVKLKLCEKSAKVLRNKYGSLPDGTSIATEHDFNTEFLDYILAVKVVDDTKEAITHINAHSTGHSEAIITENNAAAKLFLTAVDSAAVYHNCSTRFTDGGEFGLGCEMGISTQRLHARGPIGLKELCTYKFIIKGIGQIR